MKVITAKTDCKPSETGYDESRLDKLNERLADMIDRKVIHGAAYCIAHKGRVIAHAALGSGSALGGDALMQPDTVFGLASITKTFTATAIMQLVEDGIVSLTDPVGKYLPQFDKKPFSDITLLHMLTHTSGLYPDAGCFEEEYPKHGWVHIEEALDKWNGEGEFDWLTPAISNGLRRPVGSEWMYNSLAFSILGEVITKASGVFAHDFITQRIIKPLGLNDTSFDLTPQAAKRFFVYDDDTKKYIDTLISGGDPDSGSKWSRVKIPQTGGGLVSTVYDLARFGSAFALGGRIEGKRLLGRKSVEKMSRVQVSGIPDRCWGAKEDNRLYGIGFDIRRNANFNYSDNTIMHEGAGASSIDIDLDEQLAAAWFVPFGEGAGGWSAEPLYNVQNIIWSGII